MKNEAWNFIPRIDQNWEINFFTIPTKIEHVKMQPREFYHRWIIFQGSRRRGRSRHQTISCLSTLPSSIDKIFKFMHFISGLMSSCVHYKHVDVRAWTKKQDDRTCFWRCDFAVFFKCGVSKLVSQPKKISWLNLIKLLKIQNEVWLHRMHDDERVKEIITISGDI